MDSEIEFDKNCTNKKLNKIYSEIVEDFKLTIVNFTEKSRECPGLKSKWFYRLTVEESLLKKLEEKLQLSISKYVAENSTNRTGSYRAQNDAQNDESVIVLKKQIKWQKEVIRFMQMAIDKTVAPFGFDVKNVIESRKMETG